MTFYLKNKIFINKKMKIILTEDQYKFLEGIDILPDQSIKLTSANKNYIDTSLGKSSSKNKFQARITTLPESRVQVISVYKKETGDDVTDILKAIKGKESKFNIGVDEYENFINRTALFFSKEINKRPIDTIFCMQSSSSLVKDIAVKTIEKVSQSLKFIPDSIIKNIDNLELVKPETMSDSQFKSMEKVYMKAKETGAFEIKKIPPQNRKFFRNWIEVNEDAIRSITGKHIIIFDDYLTSGATLDATCMVLKELSPASIICFTILK